eukprot:gene17913-20747_t
MMEEALQIQIFAIVMLFMVSLIGMSMPLMLLTENDRKIFPYFNSLAAGVMIGLSMIHLLPDSNEMLSKLQPHFPLANLLACIGIVLTLSLEAMGRYVSEETEEALLVEKIPSNQSISQSLRLSKPSKDDLQEENQKLLLRDIEMPPSYQTIGEKDDVEQSSDKYKEELMKQRI